MKIFVSWLYCFTATSGTSWNSVGKKHVEQRSKEGSGMLALGMGLKRPRRNSVTAVRFVLIGTE